MARILVVENDAGQLEIRKQILELAGHEVVAAGTAAEALPRICGCQIVLMDLRIPKPEDGLRLIHAAEGSARVIVLSGSAPDPAVPVDQFLRKPCSSRKVLDTIEKLTA